MQTLSSELMWLTLTALLTALLWVPYILKQLASLGIFNALLVYSPEKLEAGTWPYRAYRAHMNAVENLAIFAPLALTVHVLGMSSALTAGACAIYFFARLAHVVVYVMGIPVVRTLAFAVGSFCQIALALAILGVL